MAEIAKLSVGQALEKLRGTTDPRPKMSQIDEKIGALDEEVRHLRAMRHRIERGQQAVSSTSGAQGTNSSQDISHTLVNVALAVAIGCITLAWLWMLI